MEKNHDTDGNGSVRAGSIPDDMHSLVNWRSIPQLIAVLVALSPRAPATSIIVDVEADEVIVAADSRVTHSLPVAPDDDSCKLALLGDSAVFAAVGTKEYHSQGILDRVPDWSAYSDARKAFETNPRQDIRKTAADWGDGAKAFFSTFNSFAHERLRQSAAADGGVLVLGIFVGKSETGEVILHLAFVEFVEDELLSPIKVSVGSTKVNPYAANRVTQELIDGKTDRAKALEIEWSKQAKNSPASEQKMEWFDFLLQETGKYDKQVGGPTNAVAVSKTGVRWLRKCTC